MKSLPTYLYLLRRTLLATVLILLNTADIMADRQPYHRDQLSNLHVNAIAQDSLGFVWIATANGLSRSDGTDGYHVYFNNSRNSASLPHNFVAGLKLHHDTLWIATTAGICSKPTGSNEFTRYAQQSSADGSLSKIGFVDFHGKLYTYGSGGLYLVDADDKKLQRRVASGNIFHDGVEAAGILWLSDGYRLLGYNAALRCVASQKIAADGSARALSVYGSELLVGTSDGIVRFDRFTHKLEKSPSDASFRGKYVHKIVPLSGNKVMVCSSGGGVEVYCPADGRHFNTAGKIALGTTFAKTEATTALIDAAQNLWVGTFEKGVRIVSSRPKLFNVDEALCRPFEGQFVTRIVESVEAHTAFVGTRYGGLSSFNRYTGKIRDYNHANTPWLSTFSTADFVQNLFIDSRQRLWIGYWHSLVVAQICADGSLSHLATFSEKGDAVSAAEDSRGRVWIGYSDRGVEVYGADLRLASKVSVCPNANITTITDLQDGRMLLSCYEKGLYAVDTRTLRPTPFAKGHAAELRGTIDISRTADGTLWIGTYGNGLLSLDPRTMRLRHYGGFSTDDIVAVVEDNDGNIFASSSYGLYRLNPKTGLLSTFLEKHGTLGNQYHEKCRLVSSDGSIYFGGNAGLQQIMPRNLTRDRKSPRVYLLNVKHLLSSDDDSNADYLPDFATVGELKMAYDDNSLQFDFTALSYHAPVEYSYFLEGFDKDWVTSGTRGQAVYSNLPAGDYRLLVRSRSDDAWSQPTELVRVEIAPAPWLHPLAIICYCAGLIMLFVFSTRLYVRIRLARKRYALAEEQVRLERENTQHKINFFTNVSHEIRTPITLIYAPLKYLQNNLSTLPETKISATLEYIDRNVERLLTLTNQLLRFHDVRRETLPLRVGRHDCIKQLEGIARIYNVFVSEKDQTVTFVSPYTSYECVYDSDKLEKIVNNLLINASKYTPDGGHITLKAEITHLPEGAAVAGGYNYLEVQVIDDGIGIPEEDTRGLFQRFHRLVSKNYRDRINGYGVGLNYVKELVACHKGAITPRKNLTKGMTFIVALPVDEAAFTPAEHEATAEAPLKPETAPATATAEHVEAAAADENASPRRLLLVEDNEEMLVFMKAIFESQYEVLTALNGLRALEIACRDLPDVIISDVLMPEMDGFELCEKIKTDQATSHISVLLLTAKTLDEDRIRGYQTGADMYITKPFNPEVLKSAVEGVFARQERHKRELSQAVTSDPDSLGKEELNPLDRKFLEKLYNYINDNMSSSELNVNLLGRDLGFSRTNFYRKIKQLTGQTPNDLLRLCRLRRASELILGREHTLGEISDICGFGTQSHFSTLFKKHYGVSPRDYTGKPPVAEAE